MVVVDGKSSALARGLQVGEKAGGLSMGSDIRRVSAEAPGG